VHSGDSEDSRSNSRTGALSRERRAQRSSMKLDLWSDKGFLEVQNRGGLCGGSIWGQVVNDRNQSQYSNIKISYKTKSLIYKSTGIALIGENGGAIGVRSGMNKMWVEHNKCETYMNGEHKVAGSEENKR